jgi:hypothetical protein
MTINQNLAKGLCLVGIALFFGIQARTYPFGTFSKAGSGMFPLIMSGFLLVLGGAIVVRTLFVESTPLVIHLRNIAIVTASIVGFALLSEYVNMLVALVVMVMVASYAADDFSFSRAVKVTLFLAAIAAAMRFGLGFQLPLY